MFVADLSDECHSTSVAGTHILIMKTDKATWTTIAAVSPGSSERRKSWPPSISSVETHEVVNPDGQ